MTPAADAAARLDEYIEREHARTGDWPEPQPIPGQGEPPRLSRDNLPDMLPSVLSGPALDSAERANAPAEFFVLPMFVALGAVIGRRAALAPKASDPWHEFPNLWGMVIARPGAKKSPIIGEALRPLRQIEKRGEDEWREGEGRDLERSAELLHARINAAERSSRKGTGDPSDLADLKRELRETEASIKRGGPRLTTSDATIEKLGELLAANPAGLLLTRDEIAAWLATFEKAGRQGERGAWLELWSGREPLRTDRIGRGSLSVPPSVVSVIGGTQPGKLRQYVGEATSGGAGADGLFQRFLPMWPELPPFEYVDRAPAPGVWDAYTRVFERLSRPFGSFGSSSVGGDVPILRFASGAQEVARDWLEENGRRARQESSEAMAGWLAKQPKTFCALALILHLVDAEAGAAVGISSAARAATWCELLEAHARKALGRHGDSPPIARARALDQKISEGAVVDAMSLRDLYRRKWAMLNTREDVDSAVRQLVSLSRVRLEKQSTGGRPTSTLRINPALLGA